MTTDGVVVDPSLAMRWALNLPLSAQAADLLQGWVDQGTRLLASNKPYVGGPFHHTAPAWAPAGRRGSSRCMIISTSSACEGMASSGSRLGRL